VQHIEMTQDIAGKFNRAFGEIFPIPNFRLDKGAKVVGTDGQKMSKSYGNTIEIFAEGKPLQKTVMGIKTDSTPLGSPLNPDTDNVFALYSLLATEPEKAALAEKYRQGKVGYGDAKKALYSKVEDYFAPARAKRRDLAGHLDYVEEVLRDGARRARTEAQETMTLVREAVGMKSRPVA
jgi:tryptophanyl-tRNA synthetase